MKARAEHGKAERSYERDLSTASQAQAWAEIERAIDSWALAVRTQSKYRIEDARNAYTALINEYVHGDKRKQGVMDALVKQKIDTIFD